METPIVLPANVDRAEMYALLMPQLEGLLQGEDDLIATMANICAALKEAFHWHWVGFYRVVEDELVLGPFQGPIACTRIGYGKGVCGTAWQQNRTMVVPDVDNHPGHIACSALSRSEIVVPFHDRTGLVRGVLDADSTELDHFSEVDASALQNICKMLRTCF